MTKMRHHYGNTAWTYSVNVNDRNSTTIKYFSFDGKIGAVRIAECKMLTN